MQTTFKLKLVSLKREHDLGTMTRAQGVVTDLFLALAAEPALLPSDWAAQCGEAGDSATRRVVRDYIAGMTDNYALSEHARVTGTKISLD